MDAPFPNASDEQTGDEGASGNTSLKKRRGGSVDALIAAFQEITKAADVKGDSGMTAPVPFPRPTWSPAKTIEATVTAFRKAGRRAVQRAAQDDQSARVGAERTGGNGSAEAAGTTRDPDEASASHGAGGAKAAKEGPTAEDEWSGGDSPDTSESLAPAFRQALSERAKRRKDSSRQPPLPESFRWVADAAEDLPDSFPASHWLPAKRLGERSVPAAVTDADAFLLAGEGQRPYEWLMHIRGHAEMGVYLKPIFWHRAKADDPSPGALHADGTWGPETSPEAMQGLWEQANAINRRIENLRELGGEARGGAEHRVLQFVATRDDAFAPHRVAETKDGLVYPKLSPLLAQAPEGGAPGADDELANLFS